MAKSQTRNQQSAPQQSAETATATLPASEVFEGIDPRTVAPAGVTIGAPAASEPTNEQTPPAQAPSVDATRTAMVEVPLLRTSGTYIPRSIRRMLHTADAQTLKDVLDALLADSARLTSGKRVVDVDDALAWILEQVRAGA